MIYKIRYDLIKDILKKHNIFFQLNCETSRMKDDDYVYFNENCNLEEYIAICVGNVLTNVGAYTYSFSQLSAEIKIGRYCSIASGLQFLGNDHPITSISTSPFTYSDKQTILVKPFNDSSLINKNIIVEEKRGGGTGIVIKNDVWIGQNVTLKNNITIGNGAVVAACSMVTKDVPDFAIVGGNPARIIKYRFEKDVIDELLDIQWWNYELISMNGLGFDKPHDFIRNFRKQKNQFRSIDLKPSINSNFILNHLYDSIISENVKDNSLLITATVDTLGYFDSIHNDVVFEPNLKIINFDFITKGGITLKISKLIKKSDGSLQWVDSISSNVSHEKFNFEIKGVKISISNSKELHTVYYRFKYENFTWSKVFQNGEEVIFLSNIIGLHVAIV
jgi:acetyltransferase-like isoleucine patch superfamily enzyme